MSVLAFHLAPTLAPGGFIGVDVFFVISGFLICSLLFNELEHGRFSLWRFYERRVRRILPALGVVLLATAAACTVVLYPGPLRLFGQSLVATAFSSSNFYFWLNSGYFAPTAASRPLLHTWSLGVEEQFYLCFPLLLAWLFRHHRKFLVPVIVALCVASFARASIGIFTDPVGAFYLPLARAWELGIGALLALGVVPSPSGRVLQTILGSVGLLLIAGSVALISHDTPFPGPTAAPACLGAAAVIMAGAKSPIGRLLSFPPAVFVGLVSYSLYLWHWPIIVLYKAAFHTDQISHRAGALIIAAAFALSALTWWFVERPARRMPARRAVIFGSAALGVGLASAFAATLVLGNGLPQRFSPAVAQIAQAADFDPTASLRIGSCFLDSQHSYSRFDRALCLHRTPGRRAWLLVGDSHAAHLWSAISQASPGIDVMQATASGCSATISQAANVRPYCANIMRYIFSDYLSSTRIDLLILSDAWWRGDEGRLRETLRWLNARHIPTLLLGPSPHYDEPLPILLAEGIQTHNLHLAEHHRETDTYATDQSMARLAASENVRYVSMFDIVCPQGRCREMVNARAPMMFDTDHFTPEGAQFAVTALKRLRALPEGNSTPQQHPA